MTLFADTGGLYAVEDADDEHHRDAQAFVSLLAGCPDLRLITTNFVMAEAVTLVRMRLGHKAAVDLRDRVRGSRLFTVVRVTEEDEKRAWEIFTRHNNKEFSYVDCTSFAVMEYCGIAEAFAFDKHFVQYGFRLVP